MSSMRKYPKKIPKHKYRFYQVGFYGSCALVKSQSMLIQDVDNNTFFVYKETGLIKPVKQEEINKYSLGDGYVQHYKLFSKNNYRVLSILSQGLKYKVTIEPTI
jgi:hypothetical protein